MTKDLVKIVYWHEHRSKKKAKSDFEKDFFKVDVSCSFRKSMENVKEQRDTEENICCHNQIIILQSFSQKIY